MAWNKGKSMVDTRQSAIAEQDPTEVWLADMDEQLEAARLSNESKQQQLDIVLEKAAQELEILTQDVLTLIKQYGEDTEEVV